jgi:hypothetical protein
MKFEGEWRWRAPQVLVLGAAGCGRAPQVLVLLRSIH